MTGRGVAGAGAAGAEAVAVPVFRRGAAGDFPLAEAVAVPVLRRGAAGEVGLAEAVLVPVFPRGAAGEVRPAEVEAAFRQVDVEVSEDKMNDMMKITFKEYLSKSQDINTNPVHPLSIQCRQA